MNKKKRRNGGKEKDRTSLRSSFKDLTDLLRIFAPDTGRYVQRW